MTLQSRSNAKHSSGRYSWKAIANMVQKITGQAFDYETFQAKYDATPSLQNIVSDFDDYGVTLNVKTKTHSDRNEITPEKQQSDINSSAKSAAKNTLDRV